MEVIVLPLGLALEALAGALIIAAAIDLGILTRDLFRRLPWPVYLVAEATYAAVVGSIGAVVGWSVAGAENAARTLRAVLVNPWVVHQRTAWAIGDIAAALQALRQWVIPAIAAQYAATVWARLMQEVNDRQADVNALFWTAYNWVQGLYAQMWGLYHGAIAHADQAAAGAWSHADDLHLQDLRHIDQVADQLSRSLQQAAVAIENWVEGAFTAETRYIDQVARGIEQWVQQGLSVEDARARALVGAEAAARVAGVAGVGAYALAIGEAIMQKACMQHCDTLAGLAQEYEGLSDSGIVLAIFALAGRAMRGEAGLGREIATELGPVVRSTFDGVRNLIRESAG